MQFLCSSGTVGRPCADRRSILVIMSQPPQAKPGAKRKRPLEEIPSSISLEVISIVRQDGCRIKKRIVEKTDFDPRASPMNFSDDKIIPVPDLQVDPLLPRDDTSEELPNNITSRSVSVSFLCFFTSLSIHHPSRLKYRNGSHIARNISTNFFTWNLLPTKVQPVLCADHLQNIVV